MTLSLAESEALFGRMLDGAMSDEDIATVLIEMAERGETAEELAGAVRAMRARMKCITAPAGATISSRAARPRGADVSIPQRYARDARAPPGPPCLLTARAPTASYRRRRRRRGRRGG